jgi:hypothetical protein
MAQKQNDQVSQILADFYIFATVWLNQTTVTDYKIRSLFDKLTDTLGARDSVVVKALCYNPEGRGLKTRWGDFLNLPNPSDRTRPWGLLSL